MDKRIEILDHGYCRLVETWGYGDAKIAESGIIEAARQSTQGSFRGWEKDERLLKFLYDNRHDSPFEFAGAIFEVQAPIIVFREWHRHRSIAVSEELSFNEMSGRYTELPNLTYIPSQERLMGGKQSSKNKQSSESGFSEQEAFLLTQDYVYIYDKCRKMYEDLLEKGVSRELARLVLPVAQYSRMRASANLRGWLHFLGLRLPEDAQWEIRQYGEAILGILREIFPRTLSLFDEERREAQEKQAK